MIQNQIDRMEKIFNVTMRGLTRMASIATIHGLNGNIGYKLTDNMGYTFYSTFHRLWMQA